MSFKFSDFESNHQIYLHLAAIWKLIGGHPERVGPVGIEDPVEVVDFMLEDDGSEAFYGFTHSFQSLRIGVGHDNIGVSSNRAIITWNGQAAFPTRDFLAPKGVQPGVGIDPKWLARLVKSLDADYPAVQSHLRGGDPHSVLAWIFDGIEHLGGESLELL